MSDTQIVFTFKVGAVLTNVTSAVLSDPTGTFGVRRVDSGAVVVADGTALANTGVGTYSYTFTDPAAGLTYDYWVEFVYLGNTYRIEQDISGGTGGGVSTVIPDALPTSCVSLPRFAEILEIDECSFWGVDNPSTTHEACDHMWTEKERKRVARYLHEAQVEIEQLVRYPLCPTWFVNEQHPYKWPIHTDWGKVLNPGFRNESDIHAGLAVNYATDPATLTHATTVTDEDEIHVYYAGSTREIEPSSVTISGGNVVVEIPWCRLVKPELFESTSALDYNTATNFVSTVDLVRVYNDTSIEAGLVWPHRTDADCTCDYCCDECYTCSEYTETACVYMRNPELGTLDILPATYSAGTWTSALCSSCYCTDPSWVRVNYQAGLETITADLEEAVIQLAMAKMPYSPCGCDGVKEYWKAANELDEGRASVAFGLRKVGAYRALDTVNVRSLKMGFCLG